MPIRPWRGPEGLGPGPEFTPGVWQELGKLLAQEGFKKLQGSH